MAETATEGTQNATPEGQPEGKTATAQAGATITVEELIKSNPELQSYLDKERTKAAKTREKNLRDEHDLIPKAKDTQTQSASANEPPEWARKLEQRFDAIEKTLTAKQSDEKLAALCQETGVSIEDAKDVLGLTGNESNAKERLQKYVSKTSPKSYVPGGGTHTNTGTLKPEHSNYIKQKASKF